MSGLLDENRMLNIQSMDNVMFTLDETVAMTCGFIRSILEADPTVVNISVPICGEFTLKKIIEYMIYKYEKPVVTIEKPLKHNRFSELVPTWDAAFINLEKDRLFELIQVANYMDIPPLLDLACAKAASMLKGKTPEQLEKEFGLKLTEEDKQLIVEENRKYYQ